MPWTTPTLRSVRELCRDNVSTALSGAAMVANSVLRVMSDATAAVAHLTLLYIDWLARQLMPDTSETEWLDRHGQIWLVNANGSRGRKGASFAQGEALLTGTVGTTVPQYARLVGANSIEYETLNEVMLGADATNVGIRALDGGAAGNLETDETLSVVDFIDGLDSNATVLELTGGADEESDAELRARVLKRIQQPPMGGDKTDYEQWALAVAGVTRAWCAPNEMGIGTVTVRVMLDELRWEDNGLPDQDDIIAITEYIDSVRPVTVKDFFVVAPIPEFIDVMISDLVNDDSATRTRIANAILTMLHERAAPGQTIYQSWVGEAVSIATGEDHHDLGFANHVMPTPGHIAILGTVRYE
jgi:uncharacterized phage protein gp47/JayE